ncbi:oxidoreductase, molybdopterin binding subunit [Afipia carboxidovorans OM5]|uniref:Xanthine dehydrogenase molybdenum-binding subunit XdhA n=1 Tax=Afipia carboxidovorans (strain ATCC 49405 / DSM 1227 / KCTC 32145 / OM5) TaxID=504832 RepID=B6JEI2_AFIC5|nr:xanthine dehydrogenase family protein molybdopterin-binding subunit [Afipia carboxidovorans]ACI92747.1 oxidoreductase, molybdopterin binding subunit [Afipia carboxidovorans OM5]AEI03503.1 xanthine dehydrogenase molybdenum-binding subunit XdhA [Afipia carboxidovorans OM4]AEI07080.1 xanthine dehydrogenase molybdenum-binding subunit XdhA [Afipia carboxidovorans OM5]
MNYMDRNGKMIGGPVNRIEGPKKVSGRAVYTSDHHFPGMLYAVPVPSTIASGTITTLDTSEAEKMPGVRLVLHADNMMKLYRVSNPKIMIDEKRPPFADKEVRYYGQYVAAIVADTFEQASAAANAIKVSYAAKPFDVSEHLESNKLKAESERGNVEQAFASAPVKIDETYITPTETHVAIELHATLATYEHGAFTIYEASQAVVNAQAVAMAGLGEPKENMRIVSRFIGSGFGSKLWPWPHFFVAAAAAKQLGKPVKLVLSRKMNFQSAGHRPITQQHMQLAATQDGKLVSVNHDYLNHTSVSDNYHENCGEATPFLYSVPNLRVRTALVKRNVGTPTSMRGPGAVPGLFALESAMDELAIKLKMDPVQFRLINEPKVDESSNLPFSSRHMVECLKTGADKFGWSKRTPGVGSMTRDGKILGWGMAACSWPAFRMPTEAAVELKSDGTVRAVCATQDIGTGTYTVIAQLVSEETGIPLDRIEVVLGDTDLPPGPFSGGSAATASVIPAVLQAVRQAKKAAIDLAIKTENSPLLNRKAGEVEFVGGAIGAGSERIAFDRAIEMAGSASVSGHGKSPGGFNDPLKKKYSLHSFGAHFVEVSWQPEIARLRVERVVTVIDGGRVINRKTAANQIEGAVVMGVGMALFEHTWYDPRNGAPINSNLADYVVATHADSPEIDVTFLDHPDTIFNELGARGLGEIGLAGVAAAITNATYHASGVRVRKLPAMIEDLLAV